MISSLKLARLCGVSQGTVDRALHGRAGIAEATRQRVLAAAAKHGYSPNPAAREIMTGRSHTCGAILPSGSSVFFMDLFEAVHRELRRRGLSLLLTPAANAEETTDALRELASRRPRGIILVPPTDDFVIPPELLGACPFLSLAAPCKGAIFLTPDEVRTGQEGARALWALGHRRIAFLTYRRASHAIERRQQGYLQFLRSKKLRPLILTDPSSEQILETHQQEGVTAFFCHNDWLALHCLRTLEKRGVSVPLSVSVMGVDQSPTFRELFPGLSSWVYPYESLATAVADQFTGHAMAPIAQLEYHSGQTIAPPP